MPIGIYPRTDKHKRNLGKARRGLKFSDEWRTNLSESHIGHPGYWTGKHRSKQTIEKMSEGNRGKIPWNKGLTKRDDVRIENYGRKIRGENHPNWKGGIDSLVRRIRFSYKYRQWRSDVFTRDNFTCQECSRRGGKLNAHHIESLIYILEINDVRTFEEALECEELWNTNNGITLCERCHKVKFKEVKYNGTGIDVSHSTRSGSSGRTPGRKADIVQHFLQGTGRGSDRD